MALPSVTPRRRSLRRREGMLHPLEREFGPLFEDLWAGPFGVTEPWAGSYLPPVNVREEDSQVVVSAELPGMSEDDIEVTVRRDEVRISGEKKEEEETREGDVYRMESSYGRFDRRIDLPTAVNEDQATAEFKKGVLTIRMPKQEEAGAKSKKIPVKATA